MPPSPVQLKDKLLKAIDEDHNVTNATLALEVIGLLEKVALTREDLETTRLGRDINNVRKKTKDPDIAKRCRKLLKTWQQLVNTPNNASPALGYCNSPALSVSRHSPAASAYISSSPALQPAVNKKRTSPASIHTATVVPGRLASPLVRHSSGRSSPGVAHLKRISPSNSRLTPNNSAAPTIPTVSPNQPSSRPSTPNNATHWNNAARNHTPMPISSNNHSNFTPHLDLTNRTHAANKKRRRSEESNNSDASSLKKTRTVVNGESIKLTERIKTPKVKTTAQLIEELQVQKSTQLNKSDTINKIVTNQIQKEEDDINMSVVPISARPKSRVRKNLNSGLPNPPADLGNAKSEMVVRYLETQLADDAEIDIIGDSSDTVVTSKCSKRNFGKTVVVDTSIDPYSLLPPLDYSNISWSDDVDEVDTPIHRNAITGEYPEGHEHSESNCSTPNDTTIDKLINCDWNGVNGTVNANRQFHTWTETFTIQPGEDGQTNAHVLLPYVDL